MNHFIHTLFKNRIGDETEHMLPFFSKPDLMGGERQKSKKAGSASLIQNINGSISVDKYVRFNQEPF